MTDEERYSSGELHRLITSVGHNLEAMRREAKEDRRRLSTDLQSMAGQHIELRARVNAHDRDLDDIKDEMQALDTRMRDVAKNAAVVTGGISVLGFLASLWPWGKH
jgi:chromosome segregation ATPase